VVVSTVAFCPVAAGLAPLRLSIGTKVIEIEGMDELLVYLKGVSSIFM